MCPSEMKDWSKVTIETDPCVGVTRRALSDMMEKIKVEVNRLSKSGESSNFSLLFKNQYFTINSMAVTFLSPVALL